MKLWKDSQEEVKRITPDRQMAKAILKMIGIRMKALKLKDIEGEKPRMSLVASRGFESPPPHSMVVVYVANVK